MSTESFDFIIAGGGTAGLVLATRLSEDAGQSVLVLEAGGDHSEDPRVKTPAFYTAFFGTEADWCFQTSPQGNLDGRKVTINQGKALGGSSAINAHIWAPPTKEILDAWAELGNPGWDWEIMAPYYAKAFTLPQTPEEFRKVLGVDGEKPHDGSTNGPLKLSYPGVRTHPVREAWAETFKQKGYSMKNDGPWGQASIGAFSSLASVDPVTRERNHAGKSYYGLARDRQNLRVITHAYANKILFAENEPNPRAIGVEYSINGEAHIAHARKEVIVSMGSLQSPKLLEHSGIGAAGNLKGRNFDIPLIKELPGVGENLQDHLVCDMGFAAVDELETLDGLVRQEPAALQEAMMDFVQRQDGLLTSGGIKTYAFLPVIEFLQGEGREKLLKLLDKYRPAEKDNDNDSSARGLQKKKYFEILEKTLLDPRRPTGAFLTAIGQNPTIARQPGKYLTLAAILAQPLSRGSVHIFDDVKSGSPSIDPNYLAHALDREVFAQHVKYIEAIASSAPLSGLLKQPLSHNPEAAKFNDLDDALRYVRSRSISMWHPVGTCSMLPEGLCGVVDSRLRVYGVRNLRVVDASVVPLLPPGNLQSTVYAVAERAADLIKKDHGMS
ncbi:oxidoreductase [Astrocystis sublimbata]|nr:oxidoreductase [Astrocystis sublimbata]